MFLEITLKNGTNCKTCPTVCKIIHWKFFLLLSLLSGCDSSQKSSSHIPWNRPSNWQLHRDITTDINVHKIYKPSDFNDVRGGHRL